MKSINSDPIDINAMITTELDNHIKAVEVLVDRILDLSNASLKAIQLATYLGIILNQAKSNAKLAKVIMNVYDSEGDK